MSAYRSPTGRARLIRATAATTVAVAATSLGVLGPATAARADAPQVQTRIVDLDDTMSGGNDKDSFGVSLFNPSHHHSVDVIQTFRIHLRHLRPDQVIIRRGETVLPAKAVNADEVQITDPESMHLNEAGLINLVFPHWYQLEFVAGAPAGPADVTLTVTNADGKRVGRDSAKIQVEGVVYVPPTAAPTKPENHHKGDDAATGPSTGAVGADPLTQSTTPAPAPAIGEASGTVPPPARGDAEPIAAPAANEPSSTTIFYLLSAGLAVIGSVILWLIVRRPRDEADSDDHVETVREILHPSAILPAPRESAEARGFGPQPVGQPIINQQ